MARMLQVRGESSQLVRKPLLECARDTASEVELDSDLNSHPIVVCKCEIKLDTERIVVSQEAAMR